MNDSLLPSRVLRVFSAAAGALWWLLVAFWLLLVLAWVGLHGWIVPRVGELRPQLEMQATRALGVPVRIGAVSARSDGLVPTFELRDVVLQDAQAREALRLARVVLSVSPRSLWNLGFEQLVIDGPELDLRRSSDGRLWVAGMDVSRGGEDERASDWFFRQKEILVRGGTVRWTDEQRQAPPLVLTDVQFVSRNSVRRHSLRLDATPPPGWGARLSLRGLFRQPLLSTHAGRWQDWTGQAHADLPGVDLSRLRAYTELGQQLRSGRGALRAWLDVERGRIAGGAVDVAARDVRLRIGDRPPLSLAELSGRLTGKYVGEGFELATRGLSFRQADGRRWPGGNVSLAWQPAQAREPENGRLDADHLDLAALAQIARHLPLGPRTLKLLEERAPRGVVESVQARWQGPLQQAQAYRAQGRVVGLGLPGAAGQPGLRGATIDFDLSEGGGKARLALQDGAVELPGVLPEPSVAVDRLAADVQWRVAGERIGVDVKNLELRNADVQARGELAWHTGDGVRGRFPGVLDLNVEVARAEGARVWRYLPLTVPREARDYVRQAVLGGRAIDGRIRVRGDLHDFPFPERRGGEFRIAAQVRDATYAFAPASLVPVESGQWPVLTQLSGELVFEGNGMRVRNAQGRFAGLTGLQIQADAAIADLNASTVTVSGVVRGPLAESLSVFNATPVAVSLGRPLAQANASGAGEVRLRLSLPIAQLDRSRVQGSVALPGNDIRIRPDVPLLSAVRGTVNFSDSGFTLAGVQARALGGELRAEGGTRVLPAGSSEAPTVIRIQGTASADGLRQAGDMGGVAGLARKATGAAAYALTLGLRGDGVDVAVTSNLQGLGLALPSPLDKPAEVALPLRFELAAVPGARQPTDQISVTLGDVVSARYVRDLSGPVPRVLRGALGVGLQPGESPPLPARGVLANVRLASLDVDEWAEVLGDQAPRTPTGRAAGAAAADLDYLPTLLAVRARELIVQGRTLHEVVVGGSREGPVWRANVDARQLNGYVEYRQPSQGNPGRVLARLARLSLEASAAQEVETLLDEQPASIPALDVVVDDFELRGKRLGRLEIEAVNRGGAGPVEWRLNRLSLDMPEAAFSASGNWAPVGAASARAATRERRRTVMNFRLDISDAGLLLARLGMADVVRRGRGKLEGQIAWIGSPLSLDYPSMNGNMSVNVESGQFLKADPGLAKLLGVLSLQALPRRLTLDFRDVFSEGFAFDFVRGHMNVEQGIASTNNLQMKGVNAAVLMEGRADLARETQDLRVVVVPEINAGTASLVAGVINPAIGLGTFLAQMFLREPLMRAATQEFHIAGTWTDPQVSRVSRRAEARNAPQNQAPAPGPAQAQQGVN